MAGGEGTKLGQAIARAQRRRPNWVGNFLPASAARSKSIADLVTARGWQAGFLWFVLIAIKDMDHRAEMDIDLVVSSCYPRLSTQVRPEEVERDLQAMVELGMLILYEVGGVRYGVLVNGPKYTPVRPHPKPSPLPAPPGWNQSAGDWEQSGGQGGSSSVPSGNRVGSERAAGGLPAGDGSGPNGFHESESEHDLDLESERENPGGITRGGDDPPRSRAQGVAPHDTAPMDAQRPATGEEERKGDTETCPAPGGSGGTATARPTELKAKAQRLLADKRLSGPLRSAIVEARRYGRWEELGHALDSAEKLISRAERRAPAREGGRDG